MTISELIQSLQALQQEHGDLPVYLYDTYTADEGWGDMEEWDTEGIEVGFYEGPITLDRSGESHRFIGVR